MIRLAVSELAMRHGRRWIFRDLSLEVSEGELLLVTGANGSGKSTLLDCVSGFERPTQGSIEVFGDTIFQFGRANWGSRIRHRLHGIGFRRSWQRVRLFPRLTLAEHIEIAGAHPQDLRGVLRHVLLSRGADRTDEEIWIAATKLTAAELSFGEAKLLQTALTLVGATHIAVLDEPFAGLDRSKAELLRELIRERLDRQRLAILMVEHESNRVWLGSLPTRSVSMTESGPRDDGDPPPPAAVPALVRMVSPDSANGEALDIEGMAELWRALPLGPFQPLIRPSGSRALSERQLLMLDGVARAIEAGFRFVCVVAPNGFGKTTLLLDLSSRASEAPLIRFLPIAASGLHKVRVGSLLRWAGIAPAPPFDQWTRRSIGTLSGGERKRAELAISLLGIAERTIAAVDEPTASLDSDGLGFAATCVQSAAAKATVLAMEPTRDRWGDR